MATNPIVSIIVPCFNSDKFIAETIISIQNQTFKDWECIIVDDGSTDNSKDIISHYSATDKRIKYFYQENKGLSATRNKGLSLSKGKFVQFLDSDDVLLEVKLEAQVKFLNKNPSINVVYSNYYFAHQDDLTKQYTLKHLICDKPILTFDDVLLTWEYKLSVPIHCCLFRLVSLKSVKFHEDLPSHEDWQFHLEVTRSNNYHYLPGFTSLYRVTNNSMSKDLTKMKKGTFMVINQLIIEKKKYFLVISRYSLELMQSIIEMAKGKKIPLTLIVKTPFHKVHSLEYSFIMALSIMILPYSFFKKATFRYF